MKGIREEKRRDGKEVVKEVRGTPSERKMRNLLSHSLLSSLPLPISTRLKCRESLLASEYA